jgi:hypothetical protein
VLSQQVQGQLQKQHGVDAINFITEFKIVAVIVVILITQEILIQQTGKIILWSWQKLAVFPALLFIQNSFFFTKLTVDVKTVNMSINCGRKNCEHAYLCLCVQSHAPS